MKCACPESEACDSSPCVNVRRSVGQVSGPGTQFRRPTLNPGGVPLTVFRFGRYAFGTLLERAVSPVRRPKPRGIVGYRTPLAHDRHIPGDAPLRQPPVLRL